VTTVCDIGAAHGELLSQIHRQEPTWKLVGVEVRGRPSDLPGAIGWQHELPAGHEGLVIANELLDNIPCDVVERAEDGSCLVVEVDAATGDQRLGGEAAGDQLEWLCTWWPLTETGQRAEVGLTRDALWAKVCAANRGALCIAVDYGHVASDRPTGGSLSSYRGGVQTAVAYDGRHDITAHVAFDSLASRVGGTMRRQREVLQQLGVSGERPPISKATADPAGYLKELAMATDAGELISASGLGAFRWLFRLPTEGDVGLAGPSASGQVSQ
jgi:SAM-dependent MidA family methyltransferase